MSTAHLFVEALDTAYRLGWALAGWIVFLSTVAAILILAAVATGAWGVRAVSQGVAAALAALQRSSVPEAAPGPQKPAQGRTRPTPAWAQSEPHDYHNAA